MVAPLARYGSAKAKPSGGSKSPLEQHADWLLRLVAEQPDLTLDEIVAAMSKRRIPGSRTAAWRFFERHNLTYKKARDPARYRVLMRCLLLLACLRQIMFSRSPCERS
jgi:transposase